MKLNSNQTQFIMEAHNGLSSKIVEESGFKGIWGSGLSISASMGVRDSNEASWSQVLEIADQMSCSTSVPMLLDADTGFGNFNNARHVAKRLVQRNIAGMCIEDKKFPKENSLLDKDDKKNKLADIREFTGKIRAIKDSVGENIVVVARMESFIEYEDKMDYKELLELTYERAFACKNAGADAILIHSKKKVSEDIRNFMQVWKKTHPVIIVPTNYYKTPTQELCDLGVSMIIWANHNLRASITAMQKISKQIFDEQSLLNVEHNISSVKEVFRLQNEEELQNADKRYNNI